MNTTLITTEGFWNTSIQIHEQVDIKISDTYMYRIRLKRRKQQTGKHVCSIL